MVVVTDVAIVVITDVVVVMCVVIGMVVTYVGFVEVGASAFVTVVNGGGGEVVSFVDIVCVS